jgi:hypothetical protein
MAPPELFARCRTSFPVEDLLSRFRIEIAVGFGAPCDDRTAAGLSASAPIPVTAVRKKNLRITALRLDSFLARVENFFTSGTSDEIRVTPTRSKQQ